MTHPRLAALSAALCLVASSCDKAAPPPPSAPASSTPTFQAHIGDRGPDNGLSFTISAVYSSEQPAAAAPWHASGGDWTFFDATTQDGASFVFGFRPGKKANIGGSPMSFSEAVLGAKDREAGARFAVSFAKGFHVPIPALPATQKAPTALKPSMVLLAENATRAEGGGFRGTGGGWTASKLTILHESGEEEVFLNFNLATKQGEIAEKDEDYNKPLATDVAAALRDGTFL